VPGDDGPRADQKTERRVEPPPGLSGVEAARRAVRRVHELTGLEPEGVTSLEPMEHGWKVEVEVVELERVPNTTDLMAIYQVELDEQGRMVSYRRTQRHYRGRADDHKG
jgi:hypothetical protein